MRRYEHRHPDHPWLTAEANDIIGATLTPTMTALETGSGRSTLWFARHVGRLVSVEHDPAWYTLISARIQADGITNVEYLLREMDDDEVPELSTAYVRTIERFEPDSLDFILIDGAYREGCALAALEPLRPGGLLVVDNVNWFLPSESRSPTSRLLRDGPQSPGWGAFDNATSTWRRVWTSSGVTDTGLFYKPSP